jgi:tetratricopeptide (TPR) repeat protein
MASALFMSAVLFGCAEKPASTTVPTTVPADKSVDQLGKDTLDEDACRQLAMSIEKTMNALDESAFKAAIDIDAMMDRAVAGLEVPANLRRDFLAGLRSTMNFSRGIRKAIEADGSYKFLRIHNVDGEPRVIFRMIAGGAVNYHDLILAPGKDGALKIVDIYPALAGENVSATLRRSLLPVLVEENKSFLGKLLGSESDFIANLPSIKKMQDLARQGRHKEALAACLALPASLQKDRSILAQRVTYATKVDSTAYNAAVADYKKWHPKSPALQMMLIDYYFNRKEFDKALECVDALDKSVGGDSYQDFMRANLHYAAGKPAEARVAALRSVEREPTLIQPYWTLLTLALEAKDFAEIARLLTLVEARFPLRFDALEQVEEYAEFVKSPEYAKWLAARVDEAPQE